VVVHVEVEAGALWAEEGRQLSIHSWEQREWRHLDPMQFVTVIRARAPRVRRRKFNKEGEEAGWETEMVRVDWAATQSRWTLMFEGWAITVLQAAESIQSACRLWKLSWESAQRLMSQAVERGSSAGSGARANRGSGPERLHEPHVTAAVESRDRVHRHEPRLRPAVKLSLPRALCVYDRFHIAKLLGEAVDQVRRAEHKKLQSEHDQTLKGSRYVWLLNPESLSEERRNQLTKLLKCDLKTGQAYG
jgi:transposase